MGKSFACILISVMIISASSPVVIDEDLIQNPPVGLFEEDDLLRITIRGSIAELLKDRGSDPQYHSITISYKAKDSSLVNVPANVKVRGHFRKDRGNCNLPPLLINFSKGDSKNSIFEFQDKMKLVTACRHERYVVREYLVYKLYNLFTPKSFKVRLVKVLLDDAEKGKKYEPFYGIFIEEEDQVAKRNGTTVLQGKLVRPELTKRDDFMRMAVFEYFIGNTDWSVQYQQNVRLLALLVGLPSPVPYDFDHAGIVGAPYAKPREELLLDNIYKRRYRGFCMNDMNSFNEIFEQFKRINPDIIALYTNCPYLEKSYIKNTLNYVEAFFKTINNPKAAKVDFEYPCEEGNTGNIVIKPADK